MKQVKCKISVRILTLIVGLFLSVSAFAQSTIKGIVKDSSGEPIISASVLITGTHDGVQTDLDGNFELNVAPGTQLTISYIGYIKQQVAAKNGMVVVLQPEDAQQMQEVVVIGYGSVKKSDLTGSVLAMKPDSKNKGLVVNAQDMMQGKMAGVNVTGEGGIPGGGAKIRIRGGSSLNASNDPLIVIDGVALDNTGIKGMSNPLSMVNPQDIESFNVLKDASATAIYGSRGSNGVIIITTKKGHVNQPLAVSYAGSVTASVKRKTIDVMNGDEYRKFITDMFGAGSKQVAALGKANTNWQNEIYRTAWAQDHNITVTGSVGDKANSMPFRVSAGYTNNQGIVKTSSFERYTAAVNLSPSLLNNHLNMNLNVKGMFAKNRFADGAAIGAAVSFDPTQSVYDYTLNTLATKNPVAILNLKNDRSRSRDVIANAEFDYKVHGFEDLRLHVTAGADIAQGQQDTDIAPTSPLASYYGYNGWSRQLKRNLTFNTYAQYYHDFKDAAKNHFDIMAGYEWQHFWKKDKSRAIQYYPSTNSKAGQVYKDSGKDYNGDGILEDFVYPTENYLVSFFGRSNWSLMDRYYVTATFRADGASRFKKHWAYFPSFAFAWKVKDENKFRDIKWLSDLKLRLGWGMTGQQEGIGDYNYFDIYQTGSGSNNFYPITDDGTVVRPQAVNKDLTWETTTTYNVGLDWGILNQRLTGSVDWYYRKTTDLLNNSVTVSAGSNFRNQVPSNIGSLKNTGVEVALRWRAIETKDWYWTIDYNFTYNKNEITDLTGGKDPNFVVATGGISAGTGGNAQAHAVGHPASSFYVYQQIYDKNGKPIEGAVVDRNGDGQITPADKYFYKSPMAPVTMGLASRLEYKNWDFGFSLRANIGNYVFNDLMAGQANVSPAAVWASSEFLSNRPIESIKDNWQTGNDKTVLSDRWVQNASFLKLDNITLGYSFADLFKTGGWHGLSGRVYGTASNILTLTKYKGIDPEVFSGIDKNPYPRPMSFIVGPNLNF